MGWGSYVNGRWTGITAQLHNKVKTILDLNVNTSTPEPLS